MPPKLVFHVGLAKTGTTSLQLYCHDHRRALAALGLLYPRRQVGWARNHSPLVASYIAHRPEDRSVAVRWSSREDAVRSLSTELETRACRTALVSSEHFSTHFDRSEARRLAEDFARFDPIVVMVMRDTHGRFLSSYGTHVTAGGRLTPDAYAATVLVPGTRYMSLRETIGIWEDAFGRERLRLIDYDAEQDLVGAVLRECGVDPALLPASGEYRSRASLDPATTEILRRTNERIVDGFGKAPETSLLGWSRLMLLSYLHRQRLGRRTMDRSGRWRLSERVLASLDAIAVDDATFLAETRGLTLRGSSARGRIDTSQTLVAANAG